MWDMGDEDPLLYWKADKIVHMWNFSGCGNVSYILIMSAGMFNTTPNLCYKLAWYVSIHS